MKRIHYSTLLLALPGAFLCVSEGWPPSPFTPWNLVPIILYYFALGYFRKRFIFVPVSAIRLSPVPLLATVFFLRRKRG